VTGRVLVAAALVVAGFLAQQLWLTSFLAQRAQGGLAAELDHRIATTSPVAVVYEPADLALPPFEPESVPAPQPPPAPVATEVVEGQASEPAASGDEGPAMLVSEPVPDRGAAMARLIIPSAGIDWTIVEGVNRAELRSGAGHMPDTALPGQPGNAVISGHRTTYGAPFQHLDRVEPGDLITVATASGTHTFETVESLVVEPRDTWVTEQWDGSWLTLTTCHPRFAASERLVVVARLIAGPNADILARS
jgi:LPXTG-site transpeptidase (sortase) family protein